MQKILIIQTAFTGDVVLATAVAEKLHSRYPDAKIDFLLRKGNEGLLQKHPYINQVFVWNKQERKIRNLISIIRQIRKRRYNDVINLHRFASSGLVCLFSGARRTIGFDKNPLSLFFTKTVKHRISEPGAEHPIHEVTRNQGLIEHLTDKLPAMPAIYPSAGDYAAVAHLQQSQYICIAPASVWFTKQYPEDRWAKLIQSLPEHLSIYLLGGKSDAPLAERIIAQTQRTNIQNLCGRLNFLQSAALMQGARMNYVNDSAPLHFCSAMDAPVTAIFCSTVPAFGFGPLRTNGMIVEIDRPLSCRPCGLHGHKACPEGHFKCALEITPEQLLLPLSGKTAEG